MALFEPDRLLLVIRYNLAGTGLQYNDFSWNNPDTETPGSLNNCQLLSSASAVNLKLMISEIANPEDQANAKFVELYNSGATLLIYVKIFGIYHEISNGGTWTNYKD